MSNLLSLSSNQLKRAAAIKDQIESLNEELASLLGGPVTAAQPGAKTSKKGKMSAAGRASVAAAQRARWAKVNAAKAAGNAGKPAKKKKFTMSAAAKAKISAAAKARWAKIRAAKKG